MDALPTVLESFPFQTFDKIRYCDTDRQGHVNNAVFSTFAETGRTEFLLDPAEPLTAAGASFVIASLKIDFLREIHWPGRVDIGTGVVKLGTSSLHLVQGIFQHEQCVATARTVIVQVDNTTGRSSPLSDETRSILQRRFMTA